MRNGPGYNSSDWSILMARAQEGNQDNYSCLLSEVSLYLRKYLSRKMNNMDQVEDVLQETLLTIHRVRHTFDTSRAFKPWLHAIVESRLMEFWRKHKKNQTREVLVEEYGEHDLIAEDPISKIEVEALEKVLAQLSEQQQQVIKSLKIDGNSIKETAKKMGTV